MPRGGKRKGAGKPSSWKSGCKYEDTKLIRVPKQIADRTLELAHSLDEGVDYELVTISLLEENELLKGESKSNGDSVEQLSLSFDCSLPDDQLQDLRDEALKLLKVGQQSKAYKNAKKAFDYFIDSLRNSN